MARSVEDLELMGARLKTDITGLSATFTTNRPDHPITKKMQEIEKNFYELHEEMIKLAAFNNKLKRRLEEHF